MRDIFVAPYRNGHKYDLFNNAAPPEEELKWLVAVYADDGATYVIKKANKIDLRTFYPIRSNKAGEFVPMWRSYLFVEFREHVTIDICRSTTKFRKILSARDEDGIMRPRLVRNEVVQESTEIMMSGRFNERIFVRPFRGRGSIVRIIDGPLMDKKVVLGINIPPDMKGSHKVPVLIGRVKAVIEVFRLAL